MAHVNFVYGIGSKEAETLKTDVYTLIVDGVAISIRNLFDEPREYSPEVRNQVMRELKILAEDKGFAKTQAIPPEKLAKILRDHAVINEAARHCRYKVNTHFGVWFERQLGFASQWVTKDAEGLLIGQLLFEMLCHIHSDGFYRDHTMDWKEACRTGRRHLWEKLTEVFAVA